MLSATPITALNAWTTNLYPPATGTTVSAADAQTAEQVLMNRTLYLKTSPTFDGSIGAVGSISAGANLFAGANLQVSGTSLFSGLASLSGGITVTTGAEFACDVQIDTGHKAIFNGTAEALFASTAFISGNPRLKAGSVLTVEGSGTVIDFLGGSILNTRAGSTATLAGTNTVTGATTFSGNVSVTAGNFNTQAGVTSSISGDTTFVGVTTMSGSSRLILGSRTVRRRVESFPIALGASPQWNINADGTATSVGIAGNLDLQIPLHFPDGCTIATVEVTIIGSPGHSAFPGGKPGTMPSFKVFKQAKNIGSASTAPSQVGSTGIDGSTTSGGFEVQHTIVRSLSEVVDKTVNRYYAVLTSETGAGGAQTGDIYVGTEVTYTPSAYDED